MKYSRGRQSRTVKRQTEMQFNLEKGAPRQQGNKAACGTQKQLNGESPKQGGLHRCIVHPTGHSGTFSWYPVTGIR
jgi:hypothetical protein